MKKLFLITLLINLHAGVWAQKYFTKTGHISFFSKTSVENIEAHNQQASCVLDFATGELQFQVLMKGFQFQKALMQEHFNENYVESATYPKAVFKGKMKNPATVNLNQDGVYTLEVSGELLLHGISKPLTTQATIEVKAGKVYAKAQFNTKPKDFNIKIPSAVRNNIAETVAITVDAVCMPYTR
ncbi:MAG: YceI family protein [Microscillaceae bacterium]|jgi:polyisoprenoid-binding protein YceI|nr:YceI family protein [Microscillaceae bacterium]